MDKTSLDAILNLTEALRAVESSLHSLKKELRHQRKKEALPEVAEDVPEAGEVSADVTHEPEHGQGLSSKTVDRTFPIKPTPDPDRFEKQVSVRVRVLFIKIGEIDTIRETFNADVVIQARWEEPALRGKTQQELDEMGLDDIWDPRLYVENLLTEHHEHGARRAEIENGTVVVTETQRIKGTFIENMELRRFPFDTQELSVTLTTERPTTEVQLSNDNSECLEHVQSFVEKQEWMLHQYVECRIPRTSEKNSRAAPEVCRPLHPHLSIYCQARRRPGFFIFNIIFVMIFISSLAFATFAVEGSEVSSRLKLAFTLVLTMVTFKYTVSKYLPKISYITYLDTYVLMSMSMLGVICVWHAVVTVINQYYASAVAAKADGIALITLASIYVFFNLVYFFVIALQSQFTSRIQERKDAAYLERRDRLPSIFNFSLNLPRRLHHRIRPDVT